MTLKLAKGQLFFFLSLSLSAISVLNKIKSTITSLPKIIIHYKSMNFVTWSLMVSVLFILHFPLAMQKSTVKLVACSELLTAE